MPTELPRASHSENHPNHPDQPLSSFALTQHQMNQEFYNTFPAALQHTAYDTPPHLSAPHAQQLDAYSPPQQFDAYSHPQQFDALRPLDNASQHYPYGDAEFPPSRSQHPIGGPSDHQASQHAQLPRRMDNYNHHTMSGPSDQQALSRSRYQRSQEIPTTRQDAPQPSHSLRETLYPHSAEPGPSRPSSSSRPLDSTPRPLPPESGPSKPPERQRLTKGTLMPGFIARYGEQAHLDYKAYQWLSSRGRISETTEAQKNANTAYTKFREAENPQALKQRKEGQNIARQEGTQARRYANGHLGTNLNTGSYRSVQQVHRAINEQKRPQMTEAALRRKTDAYAANPDGYESDGRDTD